jgi:DNA (cytosine-5)-methyltransferase 1
MTPENLKLIRKKLNLTQSQISKIVEVSDKTWQQWETGKSSIHVAFFNLLKERIKERINLDELLDQEPIKKSNNVFNAYTQSQISKDAENLAEITHKEERSHAHLGAFKFIDLFAGVGGIRQSFERNGGMCVFSSEIDTFAKFTYYTNFGVVPFGDITKINPESIPQHEVLCAGFPCQPFSHIGKREGFEHPTQGTMFHEIIRIIENKKTPVLFLENVPGIINHDNGNTLQVIIETLKTMGYKVQHTVLDASHFGIPQKRKRFYLVAFLDHRIKFEFPKPPMIFKDIGDFLEEGVSGHSVSEHLQQSYLFKKDDGKPSIVDKKSTGSIKTLVSTYHKIQRLTGTFVKDGETGIRLLTANECKAIMGFPSDFVIPVSRTQMYRQMGNSVVVPVVTLIAEQLSIALKTFNKQEEQQSIHLEFELV